MTRIEELCSKRVSSIDSLTETGSFAYVHLDKPPEAFHDGKQVVDGTSEMSSDSTCSVYLLRDLHLDNWARHIVSEQPLRGSNIVPEYVVKECERFKQRQGDSTCQPDVIEEAFVLLHFNFITYGHFLLEMLPKIVIFNRLKKIRPRLRIVIPARASRVIRSWIALLVADKYEPPIEYSVNAFIKKAYICDMLIVDYHKLPLMDEFVELCKEKSAVSAQAPWENTGLIKLLVSRLNRRTTGPDFRILKNEREIQTTLSDLGFHIICPETLSLAEQIKIFSKASIIVGELSSGLHNSIFSSRETPVVTVNPFNNVQKNLCLSFGQLYREVLPSDGVLRSWPGNPSLGSDYLVCIDELLAVIQQVTG